jgi:hypothetical protein
VRVSNAFLLPIAIYSAAAAALPLISRTPVGRGWWEVIVYSLFLSPTVGILALWRILKCDRSPILILTALLGVGGTLIWVCVIYKNLTG